MRPEKDRDWELPLGNDGVIAAVLMDIRDELKALNRRILDLREVLLAHQIGALETGIVEMSEPATAYPPPAPTPPPPAAHKPPVRKRGR